MPAPDPDADAAPDADPEPAPVPDDLADDADAWLDAFRDAADAVQEAVGPHVGRPGQQALGRGAGGDMSLPLDAAAEQAAMAVLEGVGDLRLVTEESGVVEYGTPHATVIMDPVDGSHNASQGIPLHSVSLALAPLEATLGAVAVGLVRNLATGQTFEAVRGGGARLDGQALRASRTTERWTVGTELWSPDDASGPDRAFWDRIVHVMERARRVRGLGSLALDVCLVGSAALDAFVDVRGFARTLDMSAGSLVLTEAGGRITDDRGRPIDDVPVDLSTRTRVVAAGNATLHAELLELLK